MSIKIIHKLAKFCEFFPRKNKHPFTTAIILAAGKGTRMKIDDITKQLVMIEDMPIVVRTMLAFERSDNIDEILIVGVEDELSLYKEFKKTYGITKLKKAIGGGTCRAQSAAHGFSMVSKNCEFVAIHDAARCLITTEDIDRVLQEAYRFNAAIAAKKVTDTVKRADEKGFVLETIDRSSIWSAQTPQVFKKTLYEVSLAKAGSLDEKITDDAMLAEQAGFAVKLVECLHENIKITTQDDLAVVKKILEKRKNGEEILNHDI